MMSPKPVVMRPFVATNFLLLSIGLAGESSAQTIISATQYSYDADGRLECTAVRMNPSVYGVLPASACALGVQGNDGPDRVTRNIYDAAGNLIQVRKAVGLTAGPATEQAEVTYGYTPNGKREQVVDGNGNRARLEYDEFDRQVRWIFPSTTRPPGYDPAATAATILAVPGSPGAAGSIDTGKYEQYGYDANGNRTSLRKRDGWTLTYQYDALNRLTRKIVPDRFGLSSTHTRDVFYDYDLIGHMRFARFDSADGEGVETVYDVLGRAISMKLTMDGVSRELTYAYDANGNRTRVTHPDGVTFWTCYDGLDRFDVAWWGGGVACPSTPGGSASVAGATQFANIDYDGAGRRSTINRASSFTDYGYDGVSRLSSLAQRFAGGAGNVTQTFAYNPASQINTLTTSNNDYVWSGTYNVNRTYTPNGLNQYVTAGSASFTYDDNGNLTSDGSTSFTYDVENRLVGASGARNATLRYDPMGRLYEIGGASGTTRFLYDGDHLVGEYANNGTLLRRYFWGPGADEPILWDEGSAMNCSGTKFLHQNHQGSVIAVADCFGNKTSINRYEEYGIPQSGNVGRFQYTGQAWLPDLGMSYYKARMYSPTLGRFMQTDPVGYDDQINLYEYVGNDPIDKTDPTGMVAGVDDAAVLGVAVIAVGAAVACDVSGACKAFSDAVYQGLDRLADYVSNNDGASSSEGDKKPVPEGVRTGSRGAVPGTGRRAGDVKPAWVKPGQDGDPRTGPKGKKSDGPQEATRGGRFGGVQGSRTQGGKFNNGKGGDGRRDPEGHRGGPGHEHPPESDGGNKKGHWWWPF